MTTLRLKGRITEDGGLEIELPPGLPAGEARVTIEIPIGAASQSESHERRLGPGPLTGQDIVQAGLTGGWAGRSLPDGTAWVADQRQKRRESRQRR